jgi:dTDP-4-dehydrorhamnose 3,5-epimerase
MTKPFTTPELHIHVEAGDVYRVLRKGSQGYVAFEEAYLTGIHQHHIKGWKRHRLMTLNLVVVSGSVSFFIVNKFPVLDDTPLYKAELGPCRNHKRLTVPPGWWVAFSGNDIHNVLLNIADRIHDPQEAENCNLDVCHPQHISSYRWTLI